MLRKGFRRGFCVICATVLLAGSLTACGGTGKNGKIFDGRSTIRGLYVFSRKSAKVYQSVSDNE